MHSNDTNNQTNNFKLLDKLFDDNPDLSEEQVLQMFNRKINKSNADDITLISDSIGDEFEALINTTFNSKRPNDQKSSANYKVGELLTSGGQSDVYFAQRNDGAYKKTVVIKVLKNKYFSEDERTGFLKEVQILADLQHPNIVNIIDAGFNQKNEPWMVLEYINGLHIKEFVVENQLSIQQIISLVSDIALALSYAHKQHIYHLDIKPENIIVRKHNNSDQAILIDFGISLDKDNINNSNSINTYATPAFASPEQLGVIKTDINHQSDIYSLGKLLKLLIPETKVDADLESIISHCLQEQPVLRYQNMQQLVDDLQKYNLHEPVSTRPLSTQQKLWKKFNKKPLINSILTFMIVSILCLITYSFIQKQQQQKLILEQTKRSQYYWNIADNIKNSTRLLYLKPINNIQLDMDKLKIQYVEMEKSYQLETIQQQQLIALAVAESAMNFGNYDKAQNILNFANETIPNNPKTRLLLANNYLNLFHQEQQKTKQYSDPKIRKHQTAQLVERFLLPAQLLFKNKTGQDQQDNRLYQSMLYYLQGQVEPALKLLDQSEKNEIWPIPRMLLASHILSVEAKKFQTLGENTLAQQWYKKAYVIINEANEIARSHPQVLENKCLIETELLISDIKLGHKYPIALSGCDDLIKVLPSTNKTIYTVSNAYVDLTRALLDQGQNPKDMIVTIDNILSNLSDKDDDPQANIILGQIHQINARWKRDSNQNSISEIKKAINYHMKAAELMPQDYLTQTEYALSLYNYASSIRPFDQGADQNYTKSTQILLGLTNHADASVLLSAQLVRILTDHGYYRYQNSLNADNQLSQASEIAKQMQIKWQKNSKAESAKRYIEWTYADYLVFQDKNPEPHLSDAIQLFDAAIIKQPGRWILRYNQISAFLSGITYFLEHGIDQSIQLAIVKQHLDELQEIVSEDVSLSSHLGYYFNMMAINQIINKQNPEQYLSKSREFNQLCVESPIDSFGCLTQIATLFETEHQWMFNNNRFNQDQWFKDIAIIDAGLIKFPEHHQLLALRVQLRMLEIKFLKLDKKNLRITLQQALADFETVINKQPLLSLRYKKDIEKIRSKLASSN